jgi:hypothetical protein
MKEIIWKILRTRRGSFARSSIGHLLIIEADTIIASRLCEEFSQKLFYRKFMYTTYESWLGYLDLDTSIEVDPIERKRGSKYNWKVGYFPKFQLKQLGFLKK